MVKRKTKKAVKDFNRCTDNNIRYYIEYDYDTEYECQSGSDCCDNDYCRCGTIVNANVPINVNNSYAIALGITKSSLTKDFRFYCLERMISCLLRGSPDCFDVQISGGYYGEEINGVTIEWSVLNAINDFVEELNKKQTKKHYRDLVESILTNEYGYVIPSIKNKDWNYEKIAIKDINPGNDSYNSMNSKSIGQYSGQSGALLSCLCKKVNGKLMLVDGYHRFAAANKREDKSMMVMWCDV